MEKLFIIGFYLGVILIGITMLVGFFAALGGIIYVFYLGLEEEISQMQTFNEESVLLSMVIFSVIIITIHIIAKLPQMIKWGWDNFKNKLN